MTDDDKRIAVELLSQMLGNVRAADDLQDAWARARMLHGAGWMATRIGLIDVDEWGRIDEAVTAHCQSLLKGENE